MMNTLEDRTSRYDAQGRELVGKAARRIGGTVHNLAGLRGQGRKRTKQGLPLLSRPGCGKRDRLIETNRKRCGGIGPASRERPLKPRKEIAGTVCGG